MQVNRYIFQSPYSSQVQVGRLDTSTSSSTGDAAGQDSSSLIKSTNQSLQNAQSFQANNVKEVKATVSSLLDTYA